MSLNLIKGERVDITKGTGIKKINVGLGWDVNQEGGAAFDLDAMAFCLDKNGKCTSGEDFIYFNHLKHSSGSIVHTGDNLTGAGDGDDEVIVFELDKIPTSIEKIAIVICIYEAAKRRQNFGMVSNASARVVNAVDNKELLKYSLTEDFSVETSVIIGEIYRNESEWKFNAVGNGKKAEINDMVKLYGLT